MESTRFIGGLLRLVEDVAISRATLPPPTWLDLATKLAAPGGVAWVLLSRKEPPAHERARLAETIAYSGP
jgi:hypothetical protein